MPSIDAVPVRNDLITKPFPERIEQLKSGDSVYFRVHLSYQIRSSGSEAASALIIISKSDSADSGKD